MYRICLFLLIPIIGFSAYKDGEVLVKIKGGRSVSSLSISGILSSDCLFDSTYKLVFKDRTVDEVVAELSKNPNIVYAEPNYIRYICVTTNDPGTPSQWALPKIKAFDGWDIEKGSSGVIIAILDTGIDYTHPDLSLKIVGSMSFVSGESPMDGNGHGTHVAGIAGASTNNSIGVSGLAWDCKLLAFKCMNNSGSGYNDDIATAIRYAADNGARVINMSLGGTEYSDLLKDACDYAYNKGAFLVAAAGNYPQIPYGSECYPAAYDNVMAVAATNQSDQKASFSNYGNWVDVAAPGVNILSTIPNNQYDDWSGTSMACPFVAGLAGLLFSHYPNWSNTQTFSAIKNTGDDIGGQYKIGRRINVFNAILGSSTLDTSTKTWTFIVYLDGDNNLEDAAIGDFLEMASIGLNDNVNIVVQFDKISNSYGWSNTKRFYITEGMAPISANAIEDIGEANMGDPNTLKSFINWAKSSYPAQNYSLILWDHGSGWKTKALEERKPKAVCYDDTSNGDSLTLKELREALSSCGKIDLIGFDACLMGMAEVSYEIKDCGDIMVASEEIEGDDGFSYDKILPYVGSNTTPYDLGKIIIDKCIDDSLSGVETISLIDLSRIGSLTLSMGSITSIVDREKIEIARKNTQEMVYDPFFNDPSYIDLIHFANNLNVFLDSECILYEKHRINGFYTGLSIYFPKEDEYLFGTYTSLLFAQNTQWDEFILRFFYPPSPSFLFISCPETITTYNTFTLTISPKDSQGNSAFSTSTINIFNLSNSISPSTYTLTGYETKIIATITESSNYGVDIITIRLSDLIATKSVNVFLNPSEKAIVSTNNVELFIPPNTFGTLTFISITETSTTSPSIKIAKAYDISANQTLQGTITAIFSYNENNGMVSGTNIKEEDLVILQGTTSIPYFLNTSSNTLTATITHLSLFIIGGTPTYPEMLTKPTVFPNPFIWHKHSFITFGDPNIIEKRLPQYGNIRIYNIVGEIITELEIKLGDGRKIWYPKEKNLASGVYIYVIESQGKRVFGKVGIIK